MSVSSPGLAVEPRRRMTVDASTGARIDAFRRARAHSRTVHLLRWLLPVLACLVAAVFIYFSYSSIPAEITVQAENSSVSDGKLVMANPKVDGFTREELPYSMTAARAVQELAKEDLVELQEINALLPVDAEQTALIKAAKGVYDRVKNTLTIKAEDNATGVRIETSDGTVANLRDVSVDVGKSTMQASGRVEIEREDASISADKLSVSENGKLFVFENKVHMVIKPSQKKPSGADGAATDGTN
ncbi:LPS export ABC transporter periplasmic protein LptC [Mesorhizobium sp. RP14(2022)]|uniref:LPS export ABC transporter periplasmic protein LptC n=1 Tax=Mesorhizobium liriopis TaxID=2953882 RepID=A0ABT1C3R9_9HYPH|nr:LPS export ABC transporter periplasmic protein LptC [Mesorhizobium liriopis]MCO6049454.1 LPS export ABC transporter periplasmic protein LptC [Mesorhizobium liriopis]